jgi:hypothetical protein
MSKAPLGGPVNGRIPIIRAPLKTPNALAKIAYDFTREQAMEYAQGLLHGILTDRNVIHASPEGWQRMGVTDCDAIAVGILALMRLVNIDPGVVAIDPPPAEQEKDPSS